MGDFCMEAPKKNTLHYLTRVTPRKPSYCIIARQQSQGNLLGIWEGFVLDISTGGKQMLLTGVCVVSSSQCVAGVGRRGAFRTRVDIFLAPVSRCSEPTCYFSEYYFALEVLLRTRYYTKYLYLIWILTQPAGPT